MPVSPSSSLNARARLANYVGSGARERETGGASERAGERPVCPPSVRPCVRPSRTLPIAFAGPLRRPQSARRWLVESEKRGNRERVGQRGGREGEGLKFKVVVALPPFPSDGGVTLSSFILT